MQIFETDHLLVREFSLSDTDSFFTINGNDQVMRYIRPPKSRHESDIFLLENIKHYKERPGTGRWAVAEKTSGAIIGMFSILPMSRDAGKLHIGYALLPSYWGRGYATLLLKKGTAYFFQHHGDSVLYAITHEENIASEKVLIKCGFSLAGQHDPNEHLWKFEMRLIASGY